MYLKMEFPMLHKNHHVLCWSVAQQKPLLMEYASIIVLYRSSVGHLSSTKIDYKQERFCRRQGHQTVPTPSCQRAVSK